MLIKKISTQASFDETQILDTLESESATDALSANQGRILNKKIQEKGTWELLAKTNSTSSSLITVSSLSEYSKVVLQCGLQNGNRILASTEGTLEQFKASTDTWIAQYYDHDNSVKYRTDTMYKSDTSIYMQSSRSDLYAVLYGVI